MANNIKGIFAEQDSYLLSQLLLTAHTNQSDLNVVTIESDQIKSTNVFFQPTGLTAAVANPVPVATAVGTQTVGAGVADGSIGPDGDPGGEGDGHFKPF